MTSTEREAWLRERKTGLGGSDAAAACGLDPWRSKLELYLGKLDQLPEKPQTQAMMMGLRMEPIIAELLQEHTGKTVVRQQEHVRSQEYPHMMATLDGIVDGATAQFKNVNQYAAGAWGDSGTDDVPEHYLLQVTHEMIVANVKECWLAVLIGGVDFRAYHLQRNDTLAARLIEIEADFWDRVQTRQAPDPQWEHASTPRLIAAIHGVDPEQCVMLGADVDGMVAEYARLGDEAKAISAARDATKAKMLHVMGEASLATLPSGLQLTRKTVARKTYTVAESSYVDFRIKQKATRKKGEVGNE